MNDKKSIDRIYQEKFRDFESFPNEMVWQNISSRLNKKKKRRLLPIWSRIAGVAAILAILFSLGNQFFGTTPSVAIEEKPFLSTPRTEAGEKIQIADETPSIPVNARNSENLIFNESENTNLNSTQKVANVSTSRSKETYNFILPFTNIDGKGFLIIEETTDLNFNVEEGIPSLPLNNQKNLTENMNNALVLLQTEKQQDQEVKSNASRLEVGTFASPIYYNGFGKGNEIDPKFADNEKETEITMAYGITFSYALTDKIKIRSGVSRVAMSYNTLDIAYGPAINPIALRNVDYGENGAELQVSDAPRSNTNSFAPVNETDAMNTDIGYINQKLGFIEFPLEVEFTIINSRFDLNVIGGASTLFVNENMLSVNSGDVSTSIGKSSNLNDVSFSTNIGIGVGYKLSEKFQLNLEPTFKYQINTFETGNFNPYYLGVFSGIQYKF